MLMINIFFFLLFKVQRFSRYIPQRIYSFIHSSIHCYTSFLNRTNFSKKNSSSDLLSSSSTHQIYMMNILVHSCWSVGRLEALKGTHLLSHQHTNTCQSLYVFIANSVENGFFLSFFLFTNELEISKKDF